MAKNYNPFDLSGYTDKKDNDGFKNIYQHVTRFYRPVDIQYAAKHNNALLGKAYSKYLVPHLPFEVSFCNLKTSFHLCPEIKKKLSALRIS